MSVYRLYTEYKIIISQQIWIHIYFHGVGVGMGGGTHPCRGRGLGDRGRHGWQGGAGRAEDRKQTPPPPRELCVWAPPLRGNRVRTPPPQELCERTLRAPGPERTLWAHGSFFLSHYIIKGHIFLFFIPTISNSYFFLYKTNSGHNMLWILQWLRHVFLK